LDTNAAQIIYADHYQKFQRFAQAFKDDYITFGHHDKADEVQEWMDQAAPDPSGIMSLADLQRRVDLMNMAVAKVREDFPIGVATSEQELMFSGLEVAAAQHQNPVLYTQDAFNTLYADYAAAWDDLKRRNILNTGIVDQVDDLLNEAKPHTLGALNMENSIEEIHEKVTKLGTVADIVVDACQDAGDNNAAQSFQQLKFQQDAVGQTITQPTYQTPPAVPPPPPQPSKISLAFSKIASHPQVTKKNALIVGGLGVLGLIASTWLLTKDTSIPEQASNVPATPPVTPPIVPTTPVVPTPSPSTAVFDVLKDFTDKVKDFPNQVLGLKYGATPASSDSFDVLKAALANGGDAKGGEPAKAVRATFEKIAREYNAQRPGLNLNADEMLYAYRKGREAAAADVPSRINGAFSELEKHISLKEANSAVPHANPIASLTDNIKQTFNNLINPDVTIASINTGVVSDMGNGILPSQQGVLSGLGQHLQHFAKTAQEAVGATARHASDAVGHAWNSEPVQSALHSSATYTVVSLAATAASVRLNAVLEARKAEAVPTEPAKNLGKRALRMASAAGEIARDFFTKDVGGKEAYLEQGKKATVQMGLLRAALIPVCAQAAIAATVIGFSSLAARGVNMVTQHHINTIEQNPMNEQQQKRLATLKTVEKVSSNVAEMKYLTDATAYAAKKAELLLTPAKEAIKETTAHIHQTMSNVLQTMAGFGRMAQQFRTA
jgi:hypothetical protein